MADLLPPFQPPQVDSADQLRTTTSIDQVPLLKNALCLMIRHKRHLTKWISPFTITGQEKLSQTHKLQTSASKISLKHQIFHKHDTYCDLKLIHNV